MLRLSRQRRYQLRNVSNGLCTLCPQILYSAYYCYDHTLRLREYRRAVENYKPWHPGGRGRPPIDHRRRNTATS